MKSSISSKDLRHQVKVRVPGSYPWKVLDKLVDDLTQYLTKEDLATIKAITRKRDIDAYLLLSEVWGPQSISPSVDTSAEQFFAKYQIAGLLKKFQFPGDSKSRRNAALEKFRAAEHACADFNNVLSKRLACLSDDWTLSAYTYARMFLSKLLGEVLPEHDQLTEWSRHGPGANLDTKERRTSLYDKYRNWPYSCTSGARALARLSIERDERWLDALKEDYAIQTGINPWDAKNSERFWSEVITDVPGNRITFVPKNSRTDRSIAIEPCMNLYLQLGVDGYIRRRLKRWGVDLDDQRKNQELARVGSVCWTDPNSYATLDLAAASDSISIELCRLLLPPQWFNHLMQLRSPQGTYLEEIFSFEKISSMGNGFTFALESAIFTSIVYGVTKALKGDFLQSDFAVYGDDIIVRKDICKEVIVMLNLCGFSINPEKSFIEGPFRESCGADWFNGIPVRPVFLSSNPSTVMELWGDLNRLRRVLYLHLWGFEFEVTSVIRNWIPVQFYDCKGPISDTDFDSYEHWPTPISRCKRGSWKFSRIVVSFSERPGDSFHFRKLMHSLRPTPDPQSLYSRNLWGGKVLSGTGSRFTITTLNAVMVSKAYSSAWYWQDEYTA